MPIIPVSMTSESYNHAQAIIAFAVTGATPNIQIQGDAQHLVDALHELVAGAPMAHNDAGNIRTITIDRGAKTYDANKKNNLDIMLRDCVASINAAETITPGLVLKV